MSKKSFMIIADYSQETPLSLEELCEACGISSDFIDELVSYDIIHVKSEEERIFDMQELARIKTALRLQRDLEINLPGIALVLDLLEELEELRSEMEIMKRHHP